MTSQHDGDRILVSYLTIRRIVGALGFLLPIVVSVGCVTIGSCTGLLPSISEYYGTDMRNVFVGVLFTIGFFLFAYRGHDRVDDIAGDFGFVFAFAIALFPVTSDSATVRAIHFISALGLFSVLSFFCLVLFTRTSKDKRPTMEKLFRNKIYRACGIAILLSIVLIAVYHFFLSHTAVANLKPIFWLETIALWAFGWSWFVKGGTLFRDSGTSLKHSELWGE